MNNLDSAQFLRPRQSQHPGPNSHRLSIASTSTDASHFSQSTRSNRINNTVNKLITKHIAVDKENPTREEERQRQRLLERYSNLLISQSEATAIEDENHIVLSLQSKLQESQNPQKAFQFGHLYNKLRSKSLKKRWSILYLLSLLSDENGDDNAPSASILRDIDNSIPAPIRRFPELSTTTDYPSRASGGHHTETATRNTRRRLTKEPPPNSEHSVEIDNVPPAVLLARALEAQGYHSANVGNIQVSETELLRDLVYIFQGIDGQYIRYDVDNRSYEFVPGIDISQPTKEIVLKLTNTGSYYLNIQTYINNAADSPDIGLLQQSLCATFQHNLADYYRFIAVLEAKIEKQMANKTALWTEDSLSLKRLLGWASQNQQELQLMDALAARCEGLKGGKLLTEIHNFTKHGDPFIKNYITRMLRSVSTPLYGMIERWIYEGELDDPFDEFFVACDAEAPRNQLWSYQYTLRENMLPNFIPEQLARKIFSIGKSLNFIRYNCHESSSSNTAAFSSVNDRQSFEYGNVQHLERAVERAYKDASATLLNLLKDKYKLMDHLKALKRYMLLGQGDFIACLIEALWSHLSKPANSIYRHNLTSILESAIRSSDAQFDDPDIIRRLDVKLLEFQKSDLGWDVFILEYHVDTPINTVLHPAAMKKYLQIFYFLWRLKRVESTLSLAWRQWFKARRDFRELVNIQQDIHSTQITIQYMIHFIYQLQHYILFEVLECSWDKLETFIEDNCIDLDSIIAAHDDYLLEITDKGFLSGIKGEQFANRLRDIFECILDYKATLDNLHSYALSVATRPAGVLAGDDPAGSRANMGKLQRIRNQQEKVEDNFRKQVLYFLSHLSAYHDEDLRSLATRLDYNGFYANLAPTDHMSTSASYDDYENGSFSMTV